MLCLMAVLGCMYGCSQARAPCGSGVTLFLMSTALAVLAFGGAAGLCFLLCPLRSAGARGADASAGGAAPEHAGGADAGADGAAPQHTASSPA